MPERPPDKPAAKMAERSRSEGTAASGKGAYGARYVDGQPTYATGAGGAGEG